MSLMIDGYNVDLQKGKITVKMSKEKHTAQKVTTSDLSKIVNLLLKDEKEIKEEIKDGNEKIINVASEAMSEIIKEIIEEGKEDKEEKEEIINKLIESKKGTGKKKKEDILNIPSNSEILEVIRNKYDTKGLEAESILKKTKSNLLKVINENNEYNELSDSKKRKIAMIELPDIIRNLKETKEELLK